MGEFAAIQQAQAMVRADGGELFTVSFPAQTIFGREYSAWTSDGLCAHDAEALERELTRTNGYADVTITKVR